MAVHKVKPYWHDKDYQAPLVPKKKKYKGKKQKPLTKEEQEKLKERRSFPWEI